MSEIQNNNIILIFNNELDDDFIVKNIKLLNSNDYNQLIIKIINNNHLDFYSYKDTFSIKNIEKAKKLFLITDKKLLFNFDVVEFKQIEMLKRESFDIFVDYYIDDLNRLNNIKDIVNNENFRIDLNIININEKISNQIKESFNNVDYYFDDDSLIKLEESDENIKNYINNFYNPTLIYYFNNNEIKLYLYSINRYFNTNIKLSEINIKKDAEQIKKLILRKILQRHCLGCDYKLNCIKQELFLYYSVKESCELKGVSNVS